MYLVSSFPVFLSIPIAFYLHTKSYIDTALIEDPVKERLLPPALAVEGNSAKTNNEAAHKLFHLLSKMFGDDVRNIGLLDLSKESLAAEIFNLQNLNEFPNYLLSEGKNPTVLPSWEIVIAQRGLSNINFPRWENDLQMMATSVFLGKDLLLSLIYHVILAGCGAILINFTLLGIIIKITLNKCYRSCKHIQQATRSLHKHFSEIVIQRVDEKGDSESVSDDEEEWFLECSSDLDIVDREESIPKADQAEEKLKDKLQESDGIQKDIPLGSFMTKDDDSGILDMSEKFTNGGSSSNNDLSKALMKFDASIDTTGAPNVLTSTFIAGETTPERFKRFLHERNEEIERLGISMDESDEDGYLYEVLDDKSTDKSNVNNQSSISYLREYLWRKLSFLN